MGNYVKINWSNYPKLDDRLLELTADNYTNEKIAETLTKEFAYIGKVFTDDMVRNRLRRVVFKSLDNDPPMVLMPHFQVYKDVIHGANVPEKIVNGQTLPKFLQNFLIGDRKTLVLSDLHIPTQHDAMLDLAVQRNKTADLVILNGDILDLHNASTFVKRRDVPIYEELDGAIRFFDWLSQQFPNTFILMTRGNHENRVYNKILPAIPAGLEFLANLDILDALARPFPNIVSIDDWFLSIGDAVYAHSDSTSAIPGKPAKDTGEWFLSHAHELGIVPPRFVVQAHTHRVSAVYTYNQKCVESGCCCLAQDYARSTRWRVPQIMGYVVTLQSNGITDLVNSREYMVV